MNVFIIIYNHIGACLW